MVKRELRTAKYRVVPRRRLVAVEYVNCSKTEQDKES